VNVSSLVTTLSVLLIVSIVFTLALVIQRPGLFDRIVGVGVIGTKTTVLLAYLGLLFGRPDAFVDIALTYGLLNFIVTLGVARYFTWEETRK
jgi:multicomponent Na+:H+ antiporter subunit F